MLTNEQKLELLQLLEVEFTLKQDNEIIFNGIDTDLDCIKFMVEKGRKFYELKDYQDIINERDNGNYIEAVDIDLWENDYRKCNDCGAWVQLDEITRTDSDNYYCDDCLENNAQWCDYHEEWEEEEMTDVNVGYGEYQYWCDNALSYHAFWSDRSEEYYSNNHYDSCRVRIGENDYATWTSDEACDYAVWCDRCDEYVQEHYYNFELDCCEWCSTDGCYDLIKSYHSSKAKFRNLRFGTSTFKEFAGIGIELEVTRDDRDENLRELLELLDEKYGDRIAFEHDGSVGDYGFEIVTAPHTKNGFYEVDWTSMLETLKEYGYSSHDGNVCGLHVHVSARMFGGTIERQNDNIAKLLLFYEKYFGDFVKISRRTSDSLHWCKPYGLCYDDFESQKSRMKKIVENTGYGDRYKAINLTNTYYRCGEYGDNENNLKTVEFRINRGTLNVKTFYATLDIIFNLVKNCKKMTWDESCFSKENIKKWFSGCKKETYDYIVKRKAFEGALYTLVETEDTTNED